MHYHYPMNIFDSLGAQQLPKEQPDSVEEEINDKDFFGYIIQSNDRVFEVTYEKRELKRKLKYVAITNEVAIVTQSTLAEFIDLIGDDDLIKIEHLGLGKKYLEGLENGE